MAAPAIEAVIGTCSNRQSMIFKITFERTVIAMNMISRTSRFRLLVSVLTTTASLLILAFLSGVATRVSASAPTGTGLLTSLAAAPNGGFWVQLDARDTKGVTGTYAVDGAPQLPTIPYRGSIAAIPGRNGYWVVTDQGAIDARGDAPILCGGQLSSCSSFPHTPAESQIIVAAAATPDGKGLWTVGRDGKVWTAGDARPFGDVRGDGTIPTGIVGTPSGKGYYIVLQDGGVYSLGDAKFYGSTGGKRPNGHDATGLALSYDSSGAVDGYWMVFDDGGVFTFGQAPFLGSTGGKSGGSVVTGIVARPNRLGYAWVHANGGVELSHLPRVVITSKQFGTAIGLLYGATDPGIQLQLLETNGRTSQQWEVRPTSGVAESGSIVQLVNVNSGLCADVTGIGPTDAKLIQWPCKTIAQGWQNQIWRMIVDPNGATQFVYAGARVDEPFYALAADSSGKLSLQLSGSGNPGWILTGAQ